MVALEVVEARDDELVVRLVVLTLDEVEVEVRVVAEDDVIAMLAMGRGV